MWFSLHNNKLNKMFGSKHSFCPIRWNSVGFLIILLAANCFETINGLSIAGDRGELQLITFVVIDFLSSF